MSPLICRSWQLVDTGLKISNDRWGMNKQRCRVSLHWPLMKASDDEGHAGRKPTGTTQCASFHLLLFLLLFPIPSPYPFSFSLSLFLSFSLVRSCWSGGQHGAGTGGGDHRHRGPRPRLHRKRPAHSIQSCCTRHCRRSQPLHRVHSTGLFVLFVFFSLSPTWLDSTVLFEKVRCEL